MEEELLLLLVALNEDEEQERQLREIQRRISYIVSRGTRGQTQQIVSDRHHATERCTRTLLTLTISDIYTRVNLFFSVAFKRHRGNVLRP